jgi:hypothetical protein
MRYTNTATGQIVEAIQWNGDIQADYRKIKTFLNQGFSFHSDLNRLEFWYGGCFYAHPATWIVRFDPPSEKLFAVYSDEYFQKTFVTYKEPQIKHQFQWTGN